MRLLQIVFQAIAYGLLLIVGIVLANVSDRTRVLRVCQGNTAVIDCEGDEIIYIHEAHYGRANNERRCVDEDTPVSACPVESHQLIWELCEGQAQCVLTASDSAMQSTRCPRKGLEDIYQKYIYIQYRCDNPGETVIGRCPGGSAWGEWVSTDNPRGGGDLEYKSNHQLLKEGCQEPTAIDIRLRDGRDYHEGGDVLQIGLDHGVSCHINQQRDGECSDYHVRYCCEKKKGCKHPGRIDNGLTRPRSERKYIRIGLKVRFICRRGFALVGDEFLECLEDATWSGIRPRCDPIVAKRGSMCKAYGDPHYLQFDSKVRYDFMGKCTYLLSATRDLDANDERWFSVETTNEERKNKTEVSYLKRVKISLSGGKEVIVLEKDQTLKLNGQTVKEINKDLYQCVRRGLSTVCSTKFGLRVSFNGDGVTLHLPDDYKEEVHGICGNFNDDDSDDMVMDSGTTAKDFTEFALSYETNSCGIPPGEVRECSPEQRQIWEEKCKHFIEGKVFESCQRFVDPTPYYEACVFDQCATGGDEDDFTAAYAEYSRDCLDAGIGICDWRTEVGASKVKCPANSVFRGCASPCQKTCANPNPSCSENRLVEACVCRQGYLLEGGRCIRRSECGCTTGGQSYSRGEQLVQPELGLICRCRGRNRFFCRCMEGFRENESVCEKIYCVAPSGIENGNFSPAEERYEVGATVTYQCNDGYGLKGASEVVCKSSGTWSFSNQACQLLCPETMEYSKCATKCPASCIDRYGIPKKACDEECTPGCVCPRGTVLEDKDSKRCIPRRDCPERGVCRGWGDPHYIMFERSSLYDFMGVCNYTFSETTTLSKDNKRWFSIQVENEVRYNRTEVSWVKNVKIVLDGGKVEIFLDKNGATVNGESSLDISTSKFVLKINRNSYRVTTDCGVTVAYNGDSVTVFAPVWYRDKVRGLCGDFNGDSSDDLKLLNGEYADNFVQYANSYQLGDCEWEPGKIRDCTEEEKLKWSGSEFCGSLINRTGVFKECIEEINDFSIVQTYYDNCILDMCATGGLQEVLTEVLTSFINDCPPPPCDFRQKLGIEPLKCSENSKYDGCASACPNTCFEPTASEDCDIGPVESCVCDDGFVLEGNRCILRENCGCIEDGTYYRKGFSIIKEDTNEDCKCLGYDEGFSCNCLTGFIRDGDSCRSVTCEDSPCSSNAYCTEDGENGVMCVCKFGFSGDGFVCNELHCNPPDNVEFATFSPTQETYSIGQDVTYKCIENYRPSTTGSHTVECTSEQTWVGSTPKCERIFCIPPVISDTAVIQSGEGRYFVGDEIVIACKRGYRLKGSSSLLCTSSGILDKQFEGCERIHCDPLDLPTVDFSTISPAKELYNVDDIVDYVCNEKYRKVHGTPLTCNSDGNWEGDSAVCTRITCQSPELPPNLVIVSANEPYFVDEKIKLNCAKGYTFIGESMITCSSDGTWDGIEAAKCDRIITCGSAPSADFSSYVPVKDQYFVGEVVNYICAKNYRNQGGDSQTCMSNGTWQGELPVCESITCPAPDIPEHTVSMSEKAQYDVGEIITYTCEHGYSSLSSNMITCTSAGTWNGTETIGCERTTCDPPPSFDFVNVNPSKNEYFVDEILSYVCIDGYRNIGGDSLICASDASWIGRRPLCEKIECPLPDSSDTNFLILTDGPFYVGDSIELGCINGYELLTAVRPVCEADGGWKGSFNVCQRIECLLLDDSDDNFVIVSEGPFYVGDSVELGCIYGYELIVDERPVCGESGTWVGSFSVCRRTLCDPSVLPSVEFSSFEPTKDRYFVDDIVNYICNEGYRNIGESSLICTVDGFWEGEIAGCERIICILPESLYGDFIIQSESPFYVGDIVELGCPFGYELITNEMPVCQADGTFGGLFEVCERILCAVSEEMGNNMLITFDEYGVGDSLIVQCISGYSLVNNDMFICGEDGDWTGVMPVCIAIECALPELLDANLRFGYEGPYFVGENLKLECVDNYELIGNEIPVCSNDGNWEGAFPICQQISCGGVENIPDGSVKYTVLDSFTVGSIATYQCNIGYRLNGNSERVCQTNGKWSGSEPTCESICDEGKVFSECASSCESTCLDRFDIPERSCQPVCIPKCVCPDEMVKLDYNSDECVEERDCPKREVCKGWGDPHYVMFEGSSLYDFMGICNYTFSETNIDKDDSRWFSVQVENEGRYGRTDVSWVKNAKILLNRGDIEIMLKKDGPEVNGEMVSDASTMHFTLRVNGNSQHVTTMHGVTITYNGNAVIIRAPTSYRGEMQGLCGDFNGNSSDDLLMATGEYADDFQEFASSYQIGDCTWKPKPLPNCSNEEIQKWSSYEMCGSLRNETGIFGGCIGEMGNAEVYYQNCILDMCATGGLQEVLIETLASYVEDCKSQNRSRPSCNWREELGLQPIKCPPNSKYDGCASACPDTCFQLPVIRDCPYPPMEDCVCDEGFIREGIMCIPTEDCGCLFEGLYFTKGSIDNRSNRICQCTGLHSMDCQCKKGYVNDGDFTKCRPARCEDDPCDMNASCTDTESLVECVCPRGFTGDGYVCNRTYCSSPPSVQFATVSRSDGQFVVDDVVEYECVENYRLTNGNTVTCTEDGTWSGSVTCEAISCGSLPSISHGSITYGNGDSFLVGSKALYKCEIGYGLQGNTERVCQSEGVWSGSEPTCESICRDGKVYSECATSCPKTCLDQFDIPVKPCPAICNTGCVCPEGMVKLHPDTDECVMERKCPKREVCKGWGDPHYIMFERSSLYDFMGICNYTFSETNIDPDDSRWFSVQVENEGRYGRTDVSWVKNAKILLNGGDIEIMLKKDGPEVNGVGASDMSTDWFTLRVHGKSQHVTTEHGVTITYNGNAVIIRAPESYRDQVQGLCGDFNGNSTDDLKMANGEYARDFQQFAISYQIGACTWEPKPLPTCSDEEMQKWSRYEMCGSLTNETGVFSGCIRELGNSDTYYKNCILDMCATGGIQEVLIETLSSYAEDCKAANLSEPSCNWREELGLEPVKCPENSKYDGCASACPNSCINPFASDNCPFPPIDDCVCDVGFLREGIMCIPAEDCGCIFERSYFTRGSIAESSSRLCECVGVNLMECRCKNGYIAMDDGSCRPARCDDGICDINSTCTDIELGVNCICDAGFTGDGFVCNRIYCSVPPMLKNALPSRITGDFVVGDTVEFTCLANYRLIDGNTMTCSEDGSWHEDAVIECEQITCSLPNGIDENLAVISVGPYEVGASIELGCSFGYRILGSRKLLCGGDGYFLGGFPTCEQIICGDLPSVEFSKILPEKDTYVVDDIVTYACFENYKLINDAHNSLICANDGNWVGSIPECERVSCPPPVLSESETFTSEVGLYYAGDEVQIGCQRGYRGGGIFTCTSDGSWHGVVICEVIICEPSDLPDVEFSSFKPVKRQYKVDDVVSYSCFENYRVVGENSLSCSVDGSWTGNPPECEEIICGDPPSVEFSKILPEKDTYVVGDVVTYTCSENYKLINDAHDSLTCANDETWIGSIPECERVSCSPPVLSESETVTSGDGPYYAGDEVQVGCQRGYRGGGSLTCTSDGTWRGGVICQILSCEPSDLPGVEFSSFEPVKREYYVNDVVSYTCVENYRLVDGDSITCSIDGLWVGNPPVCEQIVCGDPPAVKFSTMSPDKDVYVVDDVVTYTCFGNYKLINDAHDSLTCANDGNFVGSIPKCERISCPPPRLSEFETVTSGDGPYYAGDEVQIGCQRGYRGGGSSTCTSDGSWHGVAICQIIICEPSGLPDVEFSSYQPVKREYYVDDVVSYTCVENYRLVDGDSLTCTLAGSWLGNPPECKRISCNLPEATEYSITISVNGPYFAGNQFEYTCERGYKVEGSSTVRCSSSGNWDGLFTCERITCNIQGLPTVEFSYFDLVKEQYIVDDVVNYMCVDKHRKVGGGPLTCKDNGLWEGQPPVCEKIVCSVPDGIDENLVLLGAGSVEVENTAELECVYGYRLVGTVIPVCGPDGTFIGDFPTCEQIVCEDPPAVEFAIISPSQDVYLLDDVVTYICFGFYSLISGDSLRCVEDGNWVGSIPECQRVSCPLPETPEFGTITSGERVYYAGDELQYICQRGYRIVGSGSMTCSSGGIWIGLFDCERITCDATNLPVSPFATYEPVKDQYGVDDVVTYICFENYTLVSGGSLTCSVIGVVGFWDGSIPECERESCRMLPNIENGEITYNPDGSSASYSCNFGYRLQGNVQRTCDSNKEWSGTNPSCKAICIAPKEYSMCASSCPATCLDKFDIPRRVCPEICNIGCVCPKGYILEDTIGGNCVRQSRCPNRGVCRIWGDPHYIMYGRSSTFDFMGLCPYIASETSKLSRDDDRWFSVQVDNEGRFGRTDVSWVKNARILLDGGEIDILLERDGPKVNGEPVSDISGDRFTLKTSGKSQHVTTRYGVTITYNTQAVIIRTPTSYKDQLQGLCGDFNNDPSDDLKMANGSFAKDFNEFAISYQLDQDCAPPPPVPVCSDEDNKKWSSEAFCGSIIKPDGAFVDCNSVLNPQTYLEGCIFDSCITNSNEVFVQSVESFVADCKENNITLCDWREKLGFPAMKCPLNSRYDGCASACPNTCSSPNSEDFCNQPSIEFCVCNDGYILEGDRCILETDCGCTTNGRYYRQGVNITNTISNERCTCNIERQFICECLEGYVRDGRSLCRKLTCLDNPCHADASCTEEGGEVRCQCNRGTVGDGYQCSSICAAPKVYSECLSSCPSTCLDKFEIPRKPCPAICNIGCGCPSGYVLEDKDSDKCVRSSRCPNRGVCRIWGDPHYIMYGRSSTFDFMGLCPYIASETSNLSRDDDRWFSIQVENEGRFGLTDVSWVKNARIFLDGGKIDILLERDGAKVNGEPLSDANEDKFTLKTNGNSQHVTTEYGVTITYNTQAVIVRTPTSYRDQLRGLCGDFNKDPSDDLKMANGTLANDFEEFAISYQLDKDCAAPPTLPTCSDEDRARWSSKEFCGSINDGDGVFADCNSLIDATSYLDGCVFDSCVTQSNDVFIKSVESFVADCKENNITLCDWRERLRLPMMQCPPNSKYEGCASACPNTCYRRNAEEFCNEPSIEFCVCDEGYILEGNQCILEEECGCVRGQRYFRQGDRIIDSSTNQVCTCSASQSFTCECSEGYIEEDGNCRRMTCSDSPCDPQAQCTDQETGYSCVCNEGFEGDGHNCSRPTCTGKKLPSECVSPCPRTCDVMFPRCDLTCDPNSYCECPPNHVFRNALDDTCVLTMSCFFERDCEMEGKVYDDCPSSCPRTCDEPNPICTNECNTENFCVCAEDLLLHEGRCIPPSECPSRCDYPKIYQECATLCPPTCDDPEPIACEPGCDLSTTCQCEFGYVQRSQENTTCVSPTECDEFGCPGNKVYSECVSICEATCGDPEPLCTSDCSDTKYCACPPGTVLRELGGNDCIPIARCTAAPPVAICSFVDQPRSGVVLYSAFPPKSGDILRYRCNSGYRLAGGENRRCMENGEWSGTAATCIRTGIPPGHCPPPEPISNGNIMLNTPPYSYRKILIYSCDTDFTLSGNSVRICGLNGNWMSEAPICEISFP